ncbi:MAG TPA: nucleotide exchange factor GrpE [Geobacteraceae bacterium]|nr:nucleotide exchange factor GrpE [Geobacteraceae bacterium]
MEKKSHKHVEEQEAAEQAVVEGAAGGDRLKELETLLAEKEAEAAANWDKFVRERADLENYRKRTQREKEELIKYGNETLIMEILPAVDNMERALDHLDPESQDPVVVGIRMTLDMLLGALKKFGVTTVEAEKGVLFDSALHQAMGQVESDEYPGGSIAEVFQKGYQLNERLLRPAMVMVVKGP